MASYTAVPVDGSANTMGLVFVAPAFSNNSLAFAEPECAFHFSSVDKVFWMGYKKKECGDETGYQATKKIQCSYHAGVMGFVVKLYWLPVHCFVGTRPLDSKVRVAKRTIKPCSVVGPHFETIRD